MNSFSTNSFGFNLFHLALCFCDSSVFWCVLVGHSEKAMAPHSSTLAWKIPQVEGSGRVQSMGPLRVGHDWATSLSLFIFIFMHWRRKWQPTPVFLPGESQGRGALWAAIYGVSHRVRHDWSDLAAAAAAAAISSWKGARWRSSSGENREQRMPLGAKKKKWMHLPELWWVLFGHKDKIAAH